VIFFLGVFSVLYDEYITAFLTSRKPLFGSRTAPIRNHIYRTVWSHTLVTDNVT